jgi:cytochrome b6-f complex iron-sulfur subunit
MVGDPCLRRRFLGVIAQGGAALGAACLGVDCAGGPSGPIAAGNVSAVAEGTLSAVAGEAVAIGRDAQGLYAMTLICTHEGCDIGSQGSVSEEAVICNCHGSRFDANGNVVSGPARSPLQHFAVTLDSAGAITIDASTDVAETVRTAVPAT